MSISPISGSGLEASMNSSGSWPHRITTFIGCAALEIFVAMDAAVLAFGDLAAHGLAVVDLAAIGAEIEPAGVRVLRHHAVGGADEARLVQLVVARHRKFQHVDVVAFDHVLEHRARRSRSAAAAA